MVKLILLCFSIFSLMSAQAKDYFGITLDVDTPQTVCEKAQSVFADCRVSADGHAIIKGNGLIQLINPVIMQATVIFSQNQQAQSIVVLTHPLTEQSSEELIKHLNEDYDLSNLTRLEVENLVDVRGRRWDIKPLCDMRKTCPFEVKISSAQNKTN